MTAGEARGYLARFLFRGDDVFKEVRSLSGGERSRLELALLGIMPSNLLLLDEPTNHLDIPAREALEAFLRETTATLLVVSHDRRLLETMCDRLWVVDEGPGRRSTAAIAPGGRRSPTAGGSARRAGPRGGGPRPGRGRGAGGPRAATAAGSRPRRRGGGRSRWRGAHRGGGGRAGPAPARRAARPRRHGQPKLSKDAYRRQRAVIDDDLSRLGLRKGHLELALMDPSIAANFVELRRVTASWPTWTRRCAAAEEAWLLLEERAP